MSKTQNTTVHLGSDFRKILDALSAMHGKQRKVLEVALLHLHRESPAGQMRAVRRWIEFVEARSAGADAAVREADQVLAQAREETRTGKRNP